MINSRVVVVALMVFALVPVDKVMSQASDDVTTCCLPGGVCNEITEGSCSAQGGTSLFGTSCAGLQACCSADGTCSMEGACECVASGGTSSLAVCSGVFGTTTTEPCCLPDGTCGEMDTNCCLLQNGFVSRGDCTAPRACCYNDPTTGKSKREDLS